MAFFQDFPVLENAIIKFQDFPGFPGPVPTLNVIDIYTKWFGNSAGSSYWGSIPSMGAKIVLSYREFQEIKGSRNRGWNYRAWAKQIQGKQGLVRNIRRFGKPRIQEIRVTVYLKLWKPGQQTLIYCVTFQHFPCVILACLLCCLRLMSFFFCLFSG